MLQKTPTAENAVNLKLIPAIQLGAGYTIVLDLILKQRSGDTIQVLNGFHLTWTDTVISGLQGAPVYKAHPLHLKKKSYSIQG